MNSNNTLIDIPEDKGIHIKSAGTKGEKYVYKYVKYFRNADGNPRNKAKAIGKYDPITGKMHPNNNYYEMYQLDPMIPDVYIRDYGYTYLVLKVCKDIGLVDSLTAVFGVHTIDIIAMAAYIIREGNAMDGLDDWLTRNYIPDFNRLITSQTASRIFASITAAQRHCFFTQWVSHAFHGGKERFAFQSVCYDVTSVSSYSREMPEVERGYNRDGEELAQFNLGMFCDETTRMPLYYNRYNGSLTDRTNLSFVLDNAGSVGIRNVKLFLDGGFWSSECIQSLAESCKAFTVSMPFFLKESEKILDTYGNNIEKFSNELTNYHIYCVQAETEIYGVHGKVLIYYDPWNHVNLCSELSDRISGLETELKLLKRYPKNTLSRYTKYFNILKHADDSGFDYEVNTVKIDSLFRGKGYFLLFSTDMKSSPSDILYYYRAKDADEKIFAQIKDDMEGSRIRTHNETTTDGKTFVTFIASVIRSYMMNKLTKYMTDNSTSMKKVFNLLSDIMIISGQKGYRFTKALSKKQKQILAAFDSEIDILQYISS